MSRQDKTNNQLRGMYDFIKGYIRENRFPPSVREISKELGIKSTASVSYYLDKLCDMNLIVKGKNKKRTIELVENKGTYTSTTSIPLVGKIAAGTPITAVENIDANYELPTDLFGSGELFMLTVQGESMIEAGINNGDRIIIKKQNTAENGEIVAALIDNSATVKRFYKEDGYVRLKPENKTMKDIIVNDEDFMILGVLKGLIRSY